MALMFDENTGVDVARHAQKTSKATLLHFLFIFFCWQIHCLVGRYKIIKMYFNAQLDR